MKGLGYGVCWDRVGGGRASKGEQARIRQNLGWRKCSSGGLHVESKAVWQMPVPTWEVILYKGLKVR